MVRPARAADSSTLLRFVHELAAYEKAPEAVEMDAQQLAVALEGPAPVAHALLAELEGVTVGAAIYFFTFSTWTGRAGLFLEDLFVTAEHRRQGVGQALFRQVAREALARGCARFEWSVLDWNAPAINFYRRTGAQAMDEWTTFRLSGHALAAVANAV